MLQPSEIAPESWQKTGPFTLCETFSEVIVAVHRLIGLDGVEDLLAKVENSREELREAADELALVGLKPVAAVLRRHACRAKRDGSAF
jgi:hypothetical protein